MSGPLTIGRRARWAPGPKAKINWSHPLAPQFGLMPHTRTLTGKRGTLEAGTGMTFTPTAFGIGEQPISNTSRYSYVNPLTDNSNTISFLVVIGADPTATDFGAFIFSRQGIAATGVSMDSVGRMTGVWQNIDVLQNNHSGPSVLGGGVFVVAFDPSGCSIYANGAFNNRVSTTIPATNFASCTQWQTGDSAISNRIAMQPRVLLAIYNRTLTAPEVSQLTYDPFCFLED